MLAHIHGQELNMLKLSRSLDLAYNTIKKYIDTLSAAFQLIILPAYSRNSGKRLIKSPKIYLADSGILHALLNIRDINQLLGHPVYGHSFEGVIIKNIMQIFRGFTYSFYKTSHGAEVDLVMEGQGKCFAVEIKASSTPTLSRGFWNSIEDLKCDEAWVIAWVDQRSYLAENVYLTNLEDFCNYLETEGYK
jgi:predicted AAA+ superfamily ATPase